MAQAKYTLVRHDQAIDNDELFQYLRQRSERNTGRCISWLSILLLISGLSNVLLLYQLSHQCSIGPISRSQYGEYLSFLSLFDFLLAKQNSAGLTNDLDVPYTWDSEFSGNNYTQVNQLWYEDSESDQGIIALDYEYAERLGLPKSQPFP